MARNPGARSNGGGIDALVLGDGGWGTAIAITLQHAGHRVGLWSHDPDYAREMAASRRNPRFLPAAAIPPEIAIDSDIRRLAPGAGAVFSVVPTRHLRPVLRRVGPDLPEAALVVSCTKGIERETLKLPSEIIEEELGRRRIVALGGPSHAEEVCRQLPTTVVAAARDIEDARAAQRLFLSTWLRVYTGRDPTPMIAEGVETCRSVHDLARRLGVEMPITREVHAVLYEGKPPREAVASLMSRTAKEELEEI
jgi:glycerol-3-phosphate dehydrogenase